MGNVLMFASASAAILRLPNGAMPRYGSAGYEAKDIGLGFHSKLILAMAGTSLLR